MKNSSQMKTKPHLNLLIAVPSTTTWIAQFGMCLVNMVAALASKNVPGYGSMEFRVCNMRGSILPNLRLNAIQAAKEIDASHILFLDSDHTFPAMLAHQLLAWDKDVVAANCVTKQIPCQPTARAYEYENDKGVPVYSDPDKLGLEQVWRIGTGVMLVSRAAYSKLGHDCFSMPYRAEGDMYQGEDWSMCQQFEDLGFPIYVDHTISRQIGHIGTFEYTHDFVGVVNNGNL